MNHPATHGADAFAARLDRLAARLPGDPAIRQAAARTFAARGLPGPREEAWHYTSLRSLADIGFQEPLTAVSSAPSLGDLPDLPRLVLVDGRYQPGLSSPPREVAVTSFAENPLLTDRPGTMVALNTMLAEDGVQLHVNDNIDAGVIVLLSIAPDGHRPIDFHPRHRITLGVGAKLTVIELSRGQGTYLHNAVTEVEVGECAVLTHVRLQEEAPAATHVSTTFAGVSPGGAYDAFVMNLGARIARVEVHARLAGPHATAHLNGVQMLNGAQHADITTVVSHDAPNCASRQTVKTVLDGRARGVFQGKIEVARPAQKTDGYQMSQALLLSPTAEIDFKPQLEIYADDVKCSHGATVGELDADQLFYLRSRGIPPEAARAILVRAFLTEALDVVSDQRARTLLEDAIETWWSRPAEPAA